MTFHVCALTFSQNSLLTPVNSVHRTQPLGGGAVGKEHKALGVPMGHLERLQARSLQWFVDKFPDVVHITVKDLCPLMCTQSSICCSLRRFPSLSHAAHDTVVLSNVFKLVYFLLQWYAGSPFLDQYQKLPHVDNCMRQCSPGIPRLQPRGAGDISWATAGSTAGTEVYMPNTRCTERWDCSQFP